MNKFKILSFLCLSLAWHNHLFAEEHALLVGVSKYPNLPEQMHLEGPKHDVTMLNQYLLNHKQRKFSSENIILLADGVIGAKEPTKAAILKGLKDIATKAQTDDFVYLHFSGHGSRQPSSPTDLTETDGLDELFLPSDIGKWDDAVGKVKNALIDNELGQAISTIRSKGAFVWAVFDSCHSGTVTRGALISNDIKMRKVPATALGIPQKLLDKAETRKTRTRGQTKPEFMLETQKTKNKQGGFVAFYAAQTTEQTPEMRLPAGEEGRVPHGLFSFTLLQVITEHPSITYRHAAQEVLQRYAASYMDRPTPLFEGDLDAQVFEIEKKAYKPQWPIEIMNNQMHIPAGSLSRLSNGSILGITSSPADDDKGIIAYARISSTEAMNSQLIPIAYLKKAQLKITDLPDAPYARLIERKQNLSLRVAKPTNTSPKINVALASLVSKNNEGLRVEWVKSGQTADIILAEQNEQLWFLPPTGEIIIKGENKTPSIQLNNKTQNELSLALSDNLSRISRVLNLLKISQNMGAGSATTDVFLSVKKNGTGQKEKIATESVPKLYPGDIIYLTAQNPSDKPIDLNVLFIGSDYSISHWHKGRIHPNGRLKQKGLFQVNDSSFGTERIIVIASPVKQETMVQDFSFLAQHALPKTRGKSSQFSTLLKDVGFGKLKTRGVAPLDSNNDNPAILQFTLHTTATPK